MPYQVAQLSLAVNDISELTVLKCLDSIYSKDCMQYSWSYDGVNWSCFASYDDANHILVDASSDFYVKIKLRGQIYDIQDINGNSLDYTTSIDNSIDMPSCGSNSNNYNPYSGLSSALALQQSLSDSVACMIGIPIYYFKLKPDSGSKDITFKEYTLMNVDSVKQIKLIVNDGQMPSSKPEFSDFGLDWQTDWETEVSKTMFATAFGVNAQPMEGDLIYVPMMKRMWMVNEAYEEKNGSLMWVNTTFKLSLVKYQEKDSVNLGDFDSTIDTLVKTKYEDLFGDQEGLDSGEESTEAPTYSGNGMYPVYESDSCRRYVTSEGTSFVDISLYQRGTLISDRCYKFDPVVLARLNNKIVYQRKYCGNEGSTSIIVGLNGMYDYDAEVIKIGHIVVRVKMTDRRIKVSLDCVKDCFFYLPKQDSTVTDNHYFIFLRWSKKRNVVELGASQYTYNQNIPMYKLQPAHYRFDLDNLIGHKVVKWDLEMMEEDKQDVMICGLPGTLTNFKLFDVYVENMTELLQQYPTNQHLLVNDTCRKIIDMQGSGSA